MANANARRGELYFLVRKCQEKNKVTFLECIWGWDTVLCSLENPSAPSDHLSGKFFRQMDRGTPDRYRICGGEFSETHSLERKYLIMLLKSTF